MQEVRPRYPEAIVVKSLLSLHGMHVSYQQEALDCCNEPWRGTDEKDVISLNALC